MIIFSLSLCFVRSVNDKKSGQGLSLGSLIDLVLQTDPSILVTALLATTTIFACFAGAALFAKRRSYLYLGGVLSSAMTGKDKKNEKSLSSNMYLYPLFRLNLGLGDRDVDWVYQVRG